MIRTIERSQIEELLDMIEAKAPFFMRCGGLVQLHERGANDTRREEIIRLYVAGHPRRIIAARVGVCERTIYNHTRHLRRAHQ